MSDEQTLQVRDVAIPMTRQGKGEPLLFLHGNGGAEKDSAAIRLLSERYTCLVPQHPGFGGAAIPPWLERVSDLANFYLDALEQMDLRRVHVVGHDLGGWIAAEMAVRNSTGLASMTLIGSQGLRVEGVEAADLFMTSDEQLLIATFRDPAIAARAIEQMRAADDSEIRIRNREIAARLTWQPRGHDPHLAKWLHRVRIPTLIVWGAQDKLIAPATGHAWSERIPGATLALIEGCGHAPHIENPPAFVQAFLRAFDNSNFSRSSNA